MRDSESFSAREEEGGGCGILLVTEFLENSTDFSIFASAPGSRERENAKKKKKNKKNIQVAGCLSPDRNNK